MGTIGFILCPEMKTPLDLAIDAAADPDAGRSGAQVLADACGVSRQFINKMRRQWRDGGGPPRAMREHAPAIEQACRGTVQADALFPAVEWIRDSAGRIVEYRVPVPQGRAA